MTNTNIARLDSASVVRILIGVYKRCQDGKLKENTHRASD